MSNKKLDIAFCVDNTGSMGQYIAQVQQNIINIVSQIVASEKAEVRFGLVCYRDFTDEYVTKVDQFTESLKEMKVYVDRMAAKGGGDAPEAVASGLHALLSLDWRKESTKFVIFIADAPPHGLENTNSCSDSYPQGEPGGIDPFVTARALVGREIIIYSVGCEPAINQFTYARDFMKSVADMTGGKYISLAQANILSDIIIGGAKEEMNLENLANIIAEETEQVKKTGTFESEEKVYESVAQRLQARGVQTQQLQVDEVIPKSAFQHTSALSAQPNLAGHKAYASAQPAQPQIQQRSFSMAPTIPPPSRSLSSPSASRSSSSPSASLPSLSPSFGAPATSVGPSSFAFGPPAPSSSSPVNVLCGAPPTSSYSTFGAPPTSSSAFGAPPTSSYSAFGAPPTSSYPAPMGAPAMYSSSSFAPPQTQQAQTTTSGITSEQVSRLMNRKQQQQQQQQMPH